MMPREDPYESWKKSRANTKVPDGFADRVMTAIRETRGRSRQHFAVQFLLAVSATRLGRAAICVSAGALFIVRIGHVLALFVAT